MEARFLQQTLAQKASIQVVVVRQQNRWRSKARWGSVSYDEQTVAVGNHMAKNLDDWTCPRLPVKPETF
jgi:hypothetical protein